MSGVNKSQIDSIQTLNQMSARFLKEGDKYNMHRHKKKDRSQVA